jgi:hypothetical protein
MATQSRLVCIQDQTGLWQIANIYDRHCWPTGRSFTRLRGCGGCSRSTVQEAYTTRSRGLPYQSVKSSSWDGERCHASVELAGIPLSQQKTAHGVKHN